MATYRYSPGESVTIAPNGDVSIEDAAATTTFSVAPATKTVARKPPEPLPPSMESPLSQKSKPNGDLIQTYSDITKTPPVTTRVTFKGNGEVEILVTIGQDRTLMEIHRMTGIRRHKKWKDPDPEPEKWDKTEMPRNAPGSGAAPRNGSKGARKAGKKAHRSRPTRKHPAKRRPKKTPKKSMKKKGRRR